MGSREDGHFPQVYRFELSEDEPKQMFVRDGITSHQKETTTCQSIIYFSSSLLIIVI